MDVDFVLALVNTRVIAPLAQIHILILERTKPTSFRHIPTLISARVLGRAIMSCLPNCRNQELEGGAGIATSPAPKNVDQNEGIELC